jgi:hypothetical protein
MWDPVMKTSLFALGFDSRLKGESRKISRSALEEVELKKFLKSESVVTRFKFQVSAFS